MTLANVPTLNQRCNCCDRDLDGRRIVWLALDRETGRWTPATETSAEVFPFGAACAAKARKAD